MATDYAANIVALETAIATGEKRVEVNGEMVLYQDIAQMLQALAYFQAQLIAQTGANASNPAPGVTLATFGRG